MKLYGIKMHNFMRFGETDNSIVFHVTRDQKEEIQSCGLTFDALYRSLEKNPLQYIDNVNKIKDDNVLEGIVGIAGMTAGNFDSSNGSGKSTIFEAIAFLLYDRVVRQTANNDKKASAGLSVVTKLSGEYPKDLKESYVEAYFEEDEKIYRLKRGRSFTKSKKSSSPIFEFDCIKDKEVDSLSSHRKADTKKSLDQVIVEDYDIFVNTVMFGQADAGKFLTGTDKVKKDMIIELLKLEDIVHGCIDVVRAKKKIENDKLNSQTAKCDSLKSMIVNERLKRGWSNGTIDFDSELFTFVINDIAREREEEEDKKRDIEKSLVQLDADIKSLENSDAIQEIKKLIEEGKELVQSKKQKEEKKDAEIDDWTRLLSESKKKFFDCNRSIKELKINITTNVEKAKKQEDVVNAFNEEDHRQKLEKCEKAAKVKDKYEAMRQQVQEQREDIIEKISAFDAAIQFRSKDLKSLQKQVNEAGDEDRFVCKECQSLVTKEHTLKKIEDIQEVIVKNTELRDQLKIKLDKLNEARDSVKEKLKKIEQYGVQHERLIAHKNGVESAKELMKNLHGVLDQQNESLTEKHSQLAELGIKKVKYQKKCDEIEETYKKEVSEIEVEIHKKRKLVTDKKADTKLIEGQITTKKAEHTKLKNQIAEIDKKCGSLQEKFKQIIDIGEKISEQEKDIEVTRKEIQRYKILESAFGLEGVQTRIVARYLPLLNMYVKEFLDTLSNGKLLVNLFINDKSKVDMEITGGTADNYVMLSGGEKMVVRLAVDVGLSLLSFSRTSKTPDMICLDEIFGPLDPEHTKSVFKMLGNLKDRFKKVFLISHKSEIQSLVENNIIVEKSSGNRGLSRITGIRDVTV
jgi:DNA repair exonuclease SbcCD ATPase subunit